jgi:hypothetical protein
MSKKKGEDFNTAAAALIAQVTGEESPQLTEDGKNAAAVALGRLGGLKGGKARAKALSSKKRKAIAAKAAKARWGARKGKKTKPA